MLETRPAALTEAIERCDFSATVSYNEDGTYEFWVNIEMPRTKVMDGLEEAISKDQKLAVDFDQHLFMKTFDEEMALEMQKNAN